MAPWSAGDSPLFPNQRIVYGDREAPLNRDFYANIKAQGWWELRGRFERTHRAVTEQGYQYNADELVSIPATLPDLHVLVRELSQPTSGLSSSMKILVNKAPGGSSSPNLADAVMMAYWPIPRRTSNVRVSASTV